MQSEALLTRLRELAVSGRLSRRQVLKRGAALGFSAPVIASLVVACGSSGSDSTSSSNSTATTVTGASGTASGDGSATGSGASGTATGQANSGKRGGGGTLRLLYWQAPTILNVHLSQGTKDEHASRVCLEPLAHFTSDGRMKTILAAKEPTIDNGGVAKDGKTVTWKLRQGVKWHDGQPFTAKDVKFTYEWIINPDAATTSSGSYQSIESIDTPDDHTVVIHFKQPEPAWTKAFCGDGGAILPQHVLADYTGTKAKSAPFNTKPIGTGPFKVTDFKPGDTVTYAINEDYWDPGKPYFDQVILKGGGDATSAARAVLQTGEADWAWNLQVEGNVLKSLEAAGRGKLVTWPGGGTERLMPNHSDPNTTKDGQKSNKSVPHPHFKELKVRQALALAVPRDVVAKSIYGEGGEAAVATLDIPLNLIPTDISWEYNLDKAAQLLDEAGAKKNGSTRELNGRPLKWVYQTTVNGVRQKTQEVIKASLEKLDISVQLKTIESSVFFSGAAGNTDTDSHFYADLEMYTNTPANLFPISWYQRYYSPEIAQKENDWHGTNYLRYSNPDFDKMFEQVQTQIDPKQSTETFLEMQRLIWKDVAEIAIVARKNVSAASNELTGYTTSSWYGDTADIGDWRKA